MNSKNPLLQKSFTFAVQIVKLCQLLQEDKNFVLANQLLKSGTSIGANVREAQACESRADFIHKLKIAAKEANETEYWLILVQESGIMRIDHALISALTEIQKIISKSISTAKNNIHQ